MGWAAPLIYANGWSHTPSLCPRWLCPQHAHSAAVDVCELFTWTLQLGVRLLRARTAAHPTFWRRRFFVFLRPL